MFSSSITLNVSNPRCSKILVVVLLEPFSGGVEQEPLEKDEGCSDGEKRRRRQSSRGSGGRGVAGQGLVRRRVVRSGDKQEVRAEDRVFSDIDVEGKQEENRVFGSGVDCAV